MRETDRGDAEEGQPHYRVPANERTLITHFRLLD